MGLRLFSGLNDFQLRPGCFPLAIVLFGGGCWIVVVSVVIYPPSTICFLLLVLDFVVFFWVFVFLLDIGMSFVLVETDFWVLSLLVCAFSLSKFGFDLAEAFSRFSFFGLAL